MKTTKLIACLSLVIGGMLMVLSTTAMALPTATPPTLKWTRQLGTSSLDVGSAVSADGLGNVYISGDTRGNLGGTNAGISDAFLSKYDASGTLLWTEQLGTSSNDQSGSVSADGLGNVFISGTTRGNLEGTNAGGGDAFVSKYDASGTFLWTQQFGTSGQDVSSGVSADGLGNAYISGYTQGNLVGTSAGGKDAFVSKYDTNGTLLWTEQFGTSSGDRGLAVSADGMGNVYISGDTDGNLGGTNAGGRDAFVSKYDASGTLLWTEQLGTPDTDLSLGVSADRLGNVFISGFTDGSLGGTNTGEFDVFVSKYDASGTLLWTEQLGTPDTDLSLGVSADGLGNVYISGDTDGSLGRRRFGDGDTFVSKYDTSGTLLWTEQFGTSSPDLNGGVSVDGLGNVFISGYTEGNLEGVNAGEEDAFIVKFSDPIPEPSSLLLSAIATVGLWMRRRR